MQKSFDMMEKGTALTPLTANEVLTRYSQFNRGKFG